MNEAAASLERLALIAGHTLRAGARQRLLRWVAAVAILLAGGAWFLRGLNFGTTDRRFLLDVGFGAMSFFGSILAVTSAAHLFLGEWERRTVLLVLARPVSRAEFLLGKLGGIFGLLLVFCGGLTALLAGLLAWWEGEGAGAGTPVWGEWLGLALRGWGQWLRLALLATITLFAASQVRHAFLAVGAGAIALVACQLQHVATGVYRLADSPWVRGGACILSWVVPDLEVFEAVDAVAGGAPSSAALAARITVYGLAYIGVFAGLAVWGFRHREL
jgi:ABC-2 type transport system permease protein